jgi:ribosomal protein S18 acetylase RimI-like enzyme
MNKITVVPVPNRKKDIKRFVLFSWEIYKNNPAWVPPIISDQVTLITRGTYHDTGVIQPFMAYEDGNPKGRIIAHYDNNYNLLKHKKRGAVGFFECVDDPAVSAALFDTARNWLAQQGMDEMAGPLNFTAYDSSGLLLDGYDMSPSLETPYNPPYYRQHFEAYGFRKTIDWYAYRMSGEQGIPENLYRLKDKLHGKLGGIKFRNIDMSRYWDEARRMLAVFNEAWKDNQDHLPLTEKQWFHFAKEAKAVFKPELLILAEKEDQLVGYSLSVPDANQAIKQTKGRLFPFGLIRLMLAMKKIDRIKVYHVGILPEFRATGIQLYFLLETFEQAKRMGYREADLSLVVENNTNAIGVLNRIGAQRYKTFRHYSIPIIN